MLFFLLVRCGLFFLSAYRFGAAGSVRAVFPIGLSVRCGHRTEPIGKATHYRCPIFTCHAPHRADRKNNTVQKPDIYMPRNAPKRQEKQRCTEARYLHSTYVSKIYCYFSTKYNYDHHMLETHLSVKLAHARPRGRRGREDFDWLIIRIQSE